MANTIKKIKVKGVEYDLKAKYDENGNEITDKYLDKDTSQDVSGVKTFTANIKTNEVDNTNGNAMVRFKETENKVVLGGSTIPTTIMGSGDRPTYSKDGSDFSGSELALLDDTGAYSINSFTNEDNMLTGLSVKSKDTGETTDLKVNGASYFDNVDGVLTLNKDLPLDFKYLGTATFSTGTYGDLYYNISFNPTYNENNKIRYLNFVNFHYPYTGALSEQLHFRFFPRDAESPSAESPSYKYKYTNSIVIGKKNSITLEDNYKNQYIVFFSNGSHDDTKKSNLEIFGGGISKTNPYNIMVGSSSYHRDVPVLLNDGYVLTSLNLDTYIFTYQHTLTISNGSDIEGLVIKFTEKPTSTSTPTSITTSELFISNINYIKDVVGYRISNGSVIPCVFTYENDVLKLNGTEIDASSLTITDNVVAL